MIFDVKKVTYNTYSCAISGMSREMMKIDGRDSAECENWEKNDINVILELFKLEKDKRAIVSSPTFEKEKENVLEGRKTDREFELWFLVR